jgi:hypothetical protein
MGLDLPVPGVTGGADWAVKLVAAHTTTDGHDHTSGKGVQIPTGGIADLAVTGAKIAAGTITYDKLGASAMVEVVGADPRAAGLARSAGALAGLAGGADGYVKAGSGNSDWVRIGGYYGELTSTGSNLDVTGLNGDRDRLYEFTIVAINVQPVADTDVFFRFNSQTSNLRSTGNATDIYVGTARGSGTLVVRGVIWAPTGKVRQIHGTYGTYDAVGAAHVQGTFTGHWNETVTNLTSMRAFASGGFAAGSCVVLYSPLAKVRL